MHQINMNEPLDVIPPLDTKDPRNTAEAPRWRWHERRLRKMRYGSDPATDSSRRVGGLVGPFVAVILVLALLVLASGCSTATLVPTDPLANSGAKFVIVPADDERYVKGDADPFLVDMAFIPSCVLSREGSPYCGCTIYFDEFVGYSYREGDGDLTRVDLDEPIRAETYDSGDRGLRCNQILQMDEPGASKFLARASEVRIHGRMDPVPDEG